MKYKCPVCKKVLDSSIQEQQSKSEAFPFCSQRCKLIDLGAWLDTKYILSSDMQSEEPDEFPIHNTAYTPDETK